MEKVPVILHVKTQESQEVNKVPKNTDGIQKNSDYKQISDGIGHDNGDQKESTLHKIVSKETQLLEAKLEKFITNTLLSKSNNNTDNTDHKLLTNKLYQDVIKIDNPQETIINLHTQILLQPWNYTIVNGEIYFKILSILKAKEKILSEEELLNENQGKEKDSQENFTKKPHKNLKTKNNNPLDHMDGMAFIQWLSAISDENTNELNDFLQRMRIFNPLEFFQRVQNISTNINLFVDKNGTIKITNHHKDKKLIEQELNQRGRLRTHIWAMVGYNYNKQGHIV